MRNFLKNLGIATVSVFIVVSFIRFDVNVRTWDTSGRFFFVFITLLIACIVTSLQDNDNK